MAKVSGPGIFTPKKKKNVCLSNNVESICKASNLSLHCYYNYHCCKIKFVTVY